MTENPNTPDVVVPPKKAAPRRRATQGLPPAARVTAAEGYDRPTLTFMQDINAKLKERAEAEMTDIEAKWLVMHHRYIELRTMVQGVDASNAVITNEPAPTPAEQRLREPGGHVDEAALVAALDEARGGANEKLAEALRASRDVLNGDQ